MARGMTLGDLLDRPEYRQIKLCTGGPASLTRRLRGIHSTEYERPSEWVEPEWVVLSLGVRLRRNPQAQRALIAELDDAGVTALGLGLGSAFEAVPRAILDEAGRRGFPVFTIPIDTSFRDMIRDVYQGLLSEDARGYQRLVAMQHHLLDALDDDHPQETVLERLGSLVHATVAVVRRGGQVERATAPLPAEAIWREVECRPSTVMEFSVEGWRVASVPITSAGASTPRWLIAAVRREGFRTTMTKSALQITAPLLGAMSRLDEVVRRQEREVKASVLAGLAQPSSPADLPAMAARASAFGITFSEPSRVAVFARASPADGANGVSGSLAAALEGSGISHLLMDDAERTVVLLQGAPSVIDSSLETCMRDIEDGVVMATGRLAEGPEQVSDSLADATLGVARAGRMPENRVLRYEDFDLDAVLLSEVPFDRISSKVNGILEALDSHPPLRATLEAYFDHDLDVGRTAAALFLHPNSMRHRLGRIEELLGRSLRSPSTISMLNLALLAARDDTS